MPSSITFYHLHRLTCLALLSLFIAACAGYQVPLTEQVTEEKIESEATQTELVEEPEQPVLSVSSALTESLLTNLLISNLAINVQEYGLASDSMVLAADESANTLLIEKASRYALYAKNYHQAVEQGKKWIAQDSDNYLAYLVTSVAAVEAGEIVLATSLLTRLLELEKNNYAASYRRIGEIYLQHPAGLKSLEMMKKLVSLHPDVAEAWMLQAAIAQRLRNASELIGALDKVLMIDENNVRAALLKLGVLQAGTQTELQTFAGQFSKANPGAKSFKIAYGRELLKREQSELALEQFLSILSTAPKDAQALNLTALVYHSLGDFKHSASYFERHLEVSPDDDQSRVYLASALHQLGRLDEASEMVKTIEDDADRFNSYRQIAMHIEETQGADEGIAYLQAIETQNQDQQIQLIRDEGYMLTRDERPQEELALLDEQLFTFPESVLLRYQRALLYVELKNIEAHEKEMRILLELDSENAHYVNTLGYSLLLEDDRLDDAEVLINKAHALKPDDPFILDSKGWLEFKLGNAKAAILHLNQAFEIDPDPEIAAHLGEVHWSLGDQEKARKIWLDAIENHAENKSLNEVIERFIK